MSTADLVGLGITAESVLYVFSWGWGAILTSWGLGYLVGIATGLIRKI